MNIHELRQLARSVIARDISPVPVPIGGKGPNLKDWQTLRINAATVDQYFDKERLNVGGMMGPASGGLKDVDLDCKEAVALAPHFLPRTGSIYGRPGKRRSHYLYRGDDGGESKASIKLNDETKAGIVELRLGSNGKGAQSLMPGSLHPSGERYEWDVDGQIASASCATLKVAVTKIAVGTILIRHWPPLGGRHEAALTLGGFLARAGWTADDVDHFVTTITKVHGEANQPEAHGRTARDSVEALARGGDVRGLPAMREMFGEAAAKQIAKLLGYRSKGEIEAPTPTEGRAVITVGRLTTTATDSEQALLAAGVPFYERSNVLVRPIVKDVDTFHGDQTKVAQLVPVEQAYLRRKLSDVADWYRFDKRGKEWIPTDPPHDVCTSLLASAGDWPFPSIAGILTSPTMRPDGTILSALGFDPATRLLMVDSPAMPPIPDHPTKDDAVKALQLLEVNLLKEFPFVDDVAEACALSAIITPVARGAFPVVPMHVADAPRAGTGKSYLFNTVSYIATGRAMPVITAGSSEEEMEKRLGSAVLAGRSLITIDNVVNELGGAAICQLISEHRPGIRILGRTELVEVEARGMSMFANGNNITIVGDLCRRSLRIRLDAKLENPESKVFTGDPVAAVLADRGAYVAACLIICRAYIAAGRPGKLPPIGSFEAWSDTVRSALVWLGKADPVKSIDTAHADDPERISLAELHREWAKLFGTGEANAVTLKEVVDACEKRTVVTVGYGSFPEHRYVNPELRTAVQGALRGARQLDVNTLSYWIRTKKNRIVDGMWFDHRDATHGKWWVARKQGDTAPADAIPF